HSLLTSSISPYRRLGPPRTLLSFPTRRSSDLLPPPPAAIPPVSSDIKPRGEGPRIEGAELDALDGEGGEHKPAEPPKTREEEERSEEHTSELQSRENLVCRLLLEKKNRKNSREWTPNKMSRNTIPHAR